MPQYYVKTRDDAIIYGNKIYNIRRELRKLEDQFPIGANIPVKINKLDKIIKFLSEIPEPSFSKQNMPALSDYAELYDKILTHKKTVFDALANYSKEYSKEYLDAKYSLHMCDMLNGMDQMTRCLYNTNEIQQIVLGPHIIHRIIFNIKGELSTKMAELIEINKILPAQKERYTELYNKLKMLESNPSKLKESENPEY